MTPDSRVPCLLAGALVGLTLSFSGVHSGWAAGVAHDVKPNIPGPYQPAGGDLVVSLGWLDW